MPELDRRAKRGREATDVRARTLEGFTRYIGRDHAVVLAFGGQGERDRALAGTDIDRDTVPGPGENAFHQHLGLLPRNEHPLVHVEREVAKGGAAHRIGEWGSARASPRGCPRSRTHLDIQRCVTIQRRPEARHVDDGRHDIAGLSGRIRHMSARKMGGEGSHHVADTGWRGRT